MEGSVVEGRTEGPGHVCGVRAVPSGLMADRCLLTAASCPLVPYEMLSGTISPASVAESQSLMAASCLLPAARCLSP